MRQYEIHDEITHRTIEYLLNQYVKKEASILDVGCSTGRLLSFIKTKGYNNLLGIEPAPECKIIAKNKYRINITTSTLNAFKIKQKFDFIILSQVLEHLINLRSAVIKIYSLLKDDGLIFLVYRTPDGFSIHVMNRFVNFQQNILIFLQKIHYIN